MNVARSVTSHLSVAFVYGPRELGQAAGGRWGAGAFSALQWAGVARSRHQTEAEPHAYGLAWSELFPVFQGLGTGWEHANPISMRLSQCSQLSQSKRRYPEARARSMRGRPCLADAFSVAVATSCHGGELRGTPVRGSFRREGRYGCETARKRASH